MKNLSVVLMLLCITASSWAVSLADFETDLSGFTPTGSPASILERDQKENAVTSGQWCLKVTHKPSNFWPLRWVAPSVPDRLGKLQIDLTCFADDWPTQPWSRFCEKIALQSDAPGGGWVEYSTTTANWTNRLTGEEAPVDWGAWDGDMFRTVTIDISNYDLTNATYFQINFSFNCSTEGPYYIDNIRFLDEPFNPNPVNGGLGGLSTNLSWNNATDSLDFVRVWFGPTPVENPNDPNTVLSLDTYKNLLNLVYTEISPGASSICLNENIGTLTEDMEYTWCVESEPNTIPVLFWTFTATPNTAPTADAGADQYLYLNGNPDIVATLDGSNSSDDGLIAPLTYSWEQIAGPEVTIDSPNEAVTTVTLSDLANTVETWNNPAASAYVFELTVFDGQARDTDIVSITLSSNSCTASVEAGSYFYYGDIAGPDGAGAAYRDCKVDMYDLAEIAINWLRCSNIFEPCN